MRFPSECYQIHQTLRQTMPHLTRRFAMRFPSECYQIHQTLRQTMPHLAEAQSKGLALWTFGTITAQSGCQNSVIAALTFIGGFSAIRQRLQEWLYDGADRSTPSPNQINVRAR